jgi:hypothetical protein
VRELDPERKRAEPKTKSQAASRTRARPPAQPAGHLRQEGARLGTRSVLVARDLSQGGMRVERFRPEVGTAPPRDLWLSGSGAVPVWATVTRDDGAKAMALVSTRSTRRSPEQLEKVVADLPAVESFTTRPTPWAAWSRRSSRASLRPLSRRRPWQQQEQAEAKAAQENRVRCAGTYAIARSSPRRKRDEPRFGSRKRQRRSEPGEEERVVAAPGPAQAKRAASRRRWRRERDSAPGAARKLVAPQASEERVARSAPASKVARAASQARRAASGLPRQVPLASEARSEPQ